MCDRHPCSESGLNLLQSAQEQGTTSAPIKCGAGVPLNVGLKQREDLYARLQLTVSSEQLQAEDWKEGNTVMN